MSQWGLSGSNLYGSKIWSAFLIRGHVLLPFPSRQDAAHQAMGDPRFIPVLPSLAATTYRRLFTIKFKLIQLSKIKNPVPQSCSPHFRGAGATWST